MTSGPATRLLNAFCALAGQWLLSDNADCEPHGGRFAPEELGRFDVRLPSVRAAILAIASARDDGDAALLDFRLAAVVIADRDSLEEAGGAQARRLADRVAFELAREQRGDDGRFLWPRAAFSAAELDLAGESHRWEDIGDPREIRAANLYSGEIDGDGIAIWAVTWLQEFRARPGDFDLPLPEPAGIPDTVRTGRAPDIGPGREGDYETVVPEGRA